jgi:hypothetical protein
MDAGIQSSMAPAHYCTFSRFLGEIALIERSDLGFYSIRRFASWAVVVTELG